MKNLTLAKWSKFDWFELIDLSANFWHVTTMSFSSKAKIVKPKGIVREHRLVQTVNRRGSNIIKTEEVKIPPGGSQKTPSTSHRIGSTSPNKGRTMMAFDEEPIPCYVEPNDSLKKRQTLVFLFPPITNTLWQFSAPRWLLETVHWPREEIP